MTQRGETDINVCSPLRVARALKPPQALHQATESWVGPVFRNEPLSGGLWLAGCRSARDWEWPWLFHCPQDEVGLHVVDAGEGEDRVEVEGFVRLHIGNCDLQEEVGAA